MNSPGFHVEQPKDAQGAPSWESWEASWRLLLPKLREARREALGAPAMRSWCVSCHKTLTGYGHITNHKMLGHDVDVPAGPARPKTERK